MDDWVIDLDLSRPHDLLRKEIETKLHDTKLLWGMIGMVIGVVLAAAVI